MTCVWYPFAFALIILLYSSSIRAIPYGKPQTKTVEAECVDVLLFNSSKSFNSTVCGDGQPEPKNNGNGCHDSANYTSAVCLDRSAGLGRELKGHIGLGVNETGGTDAEKQDDKEGALGQIPGVVAVVQCTGGGSSNCGNLNQFETHSYISAYKSITSNISLFVCCIIKMACK
ncbi:hypothetical protein BKA69DRAFT_924220 [Paraphysoderma sedebokerense]|nr:hypothetical protein BKA69DRAFT_924220 [Paraphysoderma sedebokerense]